MDTATLAIMIICVTTINAVIVSIMAVRNRSIYYLLTWALGQWAVPVCVISFLLQTTDLPLWLSVVFGNCFIYAAVLLPVIGIAQFSQQPVSWRIPLIVFVAALTIQFIFSTQFENFQVRVAIGSLLLIYFSVLGIRCLNAMKSVPFSRLIFLNSFVILGTIYTIRLIYILFLSSEASLFDSSTVTNATFLLSLFAIWMFTYAMVIAPGEEKQHQLQELSERDSLTRLLNRRAFVARYDNTQFKDGRMVAMVIFDIDHFKQVNDKHGHHIGDLVLQEFANFVRMKKRSSDTFARLGGEEFALFFEAKNASQAMEMAQQIRSATEEHFKTRCPDLPDVTVSGGIAISRAKNPLESLLYVADHYLYQAKENGRNQIFGPSLII